MRRLKITCLVNQIRAFAQLEEVLAVLASISDRTRLYKSLNSDGLDKYLDSNLCNTIRKLNKINMLNSLFTDNLLHIVVNLFIILNELRVPKTQEIDFFHVTCMLLPTSDFTGVNAAPNLSEII